MVMSPALPTAHERYGKMGTLEKDGSSKPLSFDGKAASWPPFKKAIHQLLDEEGCGWVVEGGNAFCAMLQAAAAKAAKSTTTSGKGTVSKNVADYKERHRLVEEALVAVGGFLQHEYVASGPEMSPVPFVVPICTPHRVSATHHTRRLCSSASEILCMCNKQFSPGERERDVQSEGSRR